MARGVYNLDDFADHSRANQSGGATPFGLDISDSADYDNDSGAQVFLMGHGATEAYRDTKSAVGNDVYKAFRKKNYLGGVKENARGIFKRFE